MNDRFAPKKIARQILPRRAVKTAEETYRKSRIYALQARHGFPARRLRVIAVTGTNGKTTVCNMINAILKTNGYQTALFTTAVIEMAGQQSANKLHRTVPLTNELLAFLKRAKDKQVDFVVLEVTSQALDQHKLIGVPIEIAVMTNLTQDHLDYHGTMEQYAASKARLFNGYCRPKTIILNRDDPWYSYFKSESTGKVESYGFDRRSSLRLDASELLPSGSKFAASYKGGGTLKYKTLLLGEFNVYNAAAAVAVGMALGLLPKEVQQGLISLKSVSGRMEKIDAGQNFSVIVDYAHGPDALAKVLRAVKKIAGKGRVIVVFGATGDRDKGKRPIMGKVAAELADLIYLTDDETYSEDPQQIRQAVLDGIVAVNGQQKTTVIPDRETAIKESFKVAKRDDVVLLAGLGHQDYRAMAGGKEPWDERKVARRILRAMFK